MDEEDAENAARLDRTESARNRSSSSFVSAVPIQKTRRVLSSAGILSSSSSDLTKIERERSETEYDRSKNHRWLVMDNYVKL